MKRIITLFICVAAFRASAQDSTMNNLTKDMDSQGPTEKKAVRIFDSEKLINANTTELVGKGKMDFRIIHNFYDIAGSGGGVKSFFGIDNATDVKIGFEIGLGNKLDALIARAKGAESYHNIYSRVSRILEFGLKYKVMEQRENDPQHPLSMLLFANTAVSTMTVPTLSQPYADSAETSFKNLSERMSQVVQLNLAKKFDKVSLLLSATYVHRNRVLKGDQKNIFALGGATRIPLTASIALIIDYFHPFHSEATKIFFKNPNSVVHPVIKFHDPLSVGFEITTSGHVFHLNFTNTTEILENRFIPRTVTSWGKGQFRWGFTISRIFSLWRVKEKKQG